MKTKVVTDTMCLIAALGGEVVQDKVVEGVDGEDNVVGEGGQETAQVETNETTEGDVLCYR